MYKKIFKIKTQKKNDDEARDNVINAINIIYTIRFYLCIMRFPPTKEH